MNQPYISFVTWSRNDNYVPDQLRRMQASLDILFEQLERYRLESEIILVEWNPPFDRLPLQQALRFPASSPMVTLRAITVDPAYHKRYRFWDKKGMHGAVACNVGIRRARGLFILPKPADVVYSEPLLKFLARKSLAGDLVYRCDRCDTDRSVLDETAPGTSAFFEACERKMLLRYAKLPLDSLLAELPDLHTHGCGDFLLMSAESWNRIRGLMETRDVAAIDVDSIALHASCGAGAKQVLLPDDHVVYKPSHENNWFHRTERKGESAWRKLKRLLPFVGIGVGTQVRVQSLLNIPKRKWSNMPEVKLDSFARNFLVHALRWSKGIGPFYLNDANWGLATEDLPDRTILRADWDL